MGKKDKNKPVDIAVTGEEEVVESTEAEGDKTSELEAEIESLKEINLHLTQQSKMLEEDISNANSSLLATKDSKPALFKEPKKDTAEEQLKKTLLAKPLLKNVWFNEKGQWSFHERKGWTKVSREEILK